MPTTTTTTTDTTTDTPANLAREFYGVRGATLMARLRADGFNGRTLAERAAAWFVSRKADAELTEACAAVVPLMSGPVAAASEPEAIPADVIDRARAHLLATANPDVPPLPASDVARLALIDAALSLAGDDTTPTPATMKLPTRADVSEPRPAGFLARAVGAARVAAAVGCALLALTGFAAAVQHLATCVR